MESRIEGGSREGTISVAVPEHAVYAIAPGPESRLEAANQPGRFDGERPAYRFEVEPKQLVGRSPGASKLLLEFDAALTRCQLGHPRVKDRVRENRVRSEFGNPQAGMEDG